MRSHSVACHPTQVIEVNTPRLNRSQSPVLDLGLPIPEGWKAELTYRLTNEGKQHSEENTI